MPLMYLSLHRHDQSISLMHKLDLNEIRFPHDLNSVFEGNSTYDTLQNCTYLLPLNLG